MSPRIIKPAERRRLATELRRAYEDGASIRALAHTCGRSFGFIHQLLAEAGTTMRPVSGQKKPPIVETPAPPGPPVLPERATTARRRGTGGLARAPSPVGGVPGRPQQPSSMLARKSNR